jgi:hypothetical protein
MWLRSRGSRVWPRICPQAPSLLQASQENWRSAPSITGFRFRLLLNQQKLEHRRPFSIRAEASCTRLIGQRERFLFSLCAMGPPILNPCARIRQAMAVRLSPSLNPEQEMRKRTSRCFTAARKVRCSLRVANCYITTRLPCFRPLHQPGDRRAGRLPGKPR